MALTPDDIEERRFTLVRRGYEPAEVDDFLAEVRVAWIEAQATIAAEVSAEAAAPAPAAAPEAPGPDDFGRLGDEVAAVLRQAHESVATLRQRAETDAALVLQSAELEVARLRQEAETDRQEATRVLEQARVEAEAQMAEVRRQADGVAETAAAVARRRTQDVVEGAKHEAQAAVAVQRNVRGRLEGTRGDIDQALTRLAEEDDDLFADIDLTTALPALDEVEPVPPPGQGPPTPPVHPPRVDTSDLPYATDEGGDEADLAEADAEDEIEIDLRDADQPAEADEAEAEPALEAEAEPALEAEPEPDPDPLAQMVRRAVENALRRREDGDDADPPSDERP